MVAALAAAVLAVAALAMEAPSGLTTTPNAVSATTSFLTLPTHWLATNQWWAPLRTIWPTLSRLTGRTWRLSAPRRPAFAEHVPAQFTSSPPLLGRLPARKGDLTVAVSVPLTQVTMQYASTTSTVLATVSSPRRT